MKKALLTTALTTVLFSSTIAYAESSMDTSPAYYAKDFSINVHKDPVIIIDPPMEIVDMSAEDFEGSLNANPMNGVMLGDMAIETTAQNCMANITSANNFTLVNMDSNAELGTYSVHYIPSNNTTGQVFTFNSATRDSEIMVSCDAAYLTLTAMDIVADAPDGIYNDTVRVVVEPEA
jgi:hypothetical protein